MSDNLHLRRLQDSSKISLTESWEVRYWTDALNCTEAKLRRAVQAVGHSAASVRAWLANN